MSFNFVADVVLHNRPYPALARWIARPNTHDWNEFVNHWPYTAPAELIEHCNTFKYPYKVYETTDYPDGSYYIIGLGFFDFTINYIELLPCLVKDGVKAGRLKILFYYHEGDNPHYIKERLDSLCVKAGLSTDCYRFVSGNTAAKDIPGFVYFPDHELLYSRRNRLITPTEIHSRPRGKDFTALSRIHKWWRATLMADMRRKGWLDNSYWSYNTTLGLDEKSEDNPITVGNLRIEEYLDNFMADGPYTCDDLSSDQHNNHSLIQREHFDNSYCNIVIETLYDADGSRGAFLTEKTFKAIKHGQPFVIAGCSGSLKKLRELGYHTFDHAIDNSYDDMHNNHRRYQLLIEAIKKIKQQDMHEWFMSCWDDIQHNQRVFAESKYQRLAQLATDINAV